MAGVLYYFPGRHKIGRDEFLSAFPHTRISGEPTSNHNLIGPDKKGGCIVADPARVDACLIRFDDAKQRWMQIPGSENWVGCYTDEHKPTPDDLAMKDQIGGHLVTLADGNEWLAPVAMLLETGDCCLPSRLKMDTNRNWITGDVVEEYAALWNLACKWWDFWTYQGPEEDRPVFLDNDFINGAVNCLSANYVVSADEVVLLGLLTGSATRSVYYALIDHPSFESLKKKEAHAG